MPAPKPITPPPAPPPKTDVIVVAPPPPPPPPPPKQNRAIQALVEGLAILTFFGLTIIPLARFGLVPLTSEQQVDLLIAAGVLLSLDVLLYPLVHYHGSVLSLEKSLARKTRQDLVLNSLAVAATITLGIIILVETVAVLVYTKTIQSTSQLIVEAADNFILFSTFTLLLLDMLLIGRTSFQTRYKGRSWYRDVSIALLGLGFILFVLAALKNHDLLSQGPFAGIKASQSPYILTLGVLLQLLAFKLYLRYPPIVRIILTEAEAARKANRELRDILQRRAFRAYFFGLLFVLLSFVLVGGISTGRVATGDTRTTNFIVAGYLILGLIVIGLVFTRYIQHKYIYNRQKRKDEGEVIARKRLTRDQLNAIVAYSFSGVFAALFAILATLTFLGRIGFDEKFGTDFLILAFLVGVGPFGWRRMMHLHRVKAMDDKFPDFLRDLAEGVRAGMTLPRALYSAARGVYGALTPEIKRMSSQVEWGVSFDEALRRFATRVKTPLIERSVSLISEASKAGGSVVDILTAASQDSREIKQIIDERSRQMGIYAVIIYVAFLVFLVVVYVLAAQFLPSFESAVQGASGAQVGGLKFAPFDRGLYVQIFFHAALFQGIGGGLVSGVMTEGHPLGGLKHCFVLTIFSWVFFRLLL